MPIEMICQNCNNPFYCYPSDAKAGRKYCTLTCRSNDRSVLPLPAASRTPINFTCQECNKPFVMMKSYVAAYKKKFDREPMYCSMKCSGAGRRRTAEAAHTFTCVECGKEKTLRRGPGGRLYIEQKYCDQKCKSAHQKTRALAKFDRGEISEHTKRHGYVWIAVPSLVTGKKHEMLKHRYVMSKKIGRELFPEETVHHINGIRSDNNPENLELFSNRHGPGQRVTDKVQFAIEILTLYPEFCTSAGYSVPQKLHTTVEPPAIPEASH